MRKKLTVLFLALVFSLTFAFGSVSTAFAASAKLSVSGGGSYTVGDTVTVKYTLSASNIGVADMRVEYKSSVLQFVSCSGAEAYGDSGVVSANTIGGANVSSITVTMKFKAINTGSSSVTVSEGAGGVITYNEEALSVSSASTTVNVKAKASAKASGNANLSSMKVSAGALSPAFSPDVTNYTVNVGNEITTCTVSVTTAHAKANVKISGSPDLAVGANIRKLTVTAENGNTKVYTITINRSAEPSGEEEPTEEEKPGELKVQVGDKEYVVCEDLNEQEIPESFVMTTAKMGDSEIPAIKDKELKYTMVLLRDSETGDESWFFYDEESDTCSPTADVDAETMIRYEKALTSVPDEIDTQKGGLSTSDKVLFIAFGITAAALLAVIIVLQVKIFKARREK